MIIPPDSLSAEALHNVIEQFVLREGTDYGEGEFSLADKVAEVMRQVEQGEAVLIYSQAHQSVDIVPKSVVMAQSAKQSKKTS